MFLELLLFSLTYISIRIYLWYRKRVKTHQRFIRKGINGPKPALISGNLYELRKFNNPNLIIDKWIDEYGDSFGYFLGDRPFLVINDLDSIKKIFITNSGKKFRDRPPNFIGAKPFTDSIVFLRGDRWKHVRKVITPTFSHNKVMSNDIIDIIIGCVNTFIGFVEQQDSKTPIINIEDRMQALTLDVINKCALNLNYNKPQESNDKLLVALNEFLNNAMNPAVDLALFFPFLRPVFRLINNYLTAGRMTDMTVKHLNERIAEFETERKVSNFKIDNKLNNNNLLDSLLNCYREQKITKNELIANAYIILIAGFETTSTALTFTFYLLAKHQSIQDKLRTEILLKGYKCKYLEMVWNESLRLYPPVVGFVSRIASEDTVINGLFIEKNTSVQAPVWRIQHNPNIWSNPYDFNPERFSPENKSQINPLAFLAFGLGPRSCIGVDFARLEAMITISIILTKFRIEFCEQTNDPLVLRCPTGVVIKPSVPIYLRFSSISE